MGDLSEHFSRWEFREHGSGKLIDPPHELLQVLECLRSSTGGRPLRIVSGYRSEVYNRRVGGARASRHIHGDAADLEPGRITVAQALSCGARGVGHDDAGWVVHVDVRPGRQVTFRDV